jgi:MYXO-CTERM domain-containing protein
VLQILARASTPQIIAPPTTCSGGRADDDLSAGGGNGSPPTANEGTDGGVTVEELPQVGPFDPIVVSGTDAAELIDWLNTNGYVITPEMEPFIEGYVEAGMKFLAMKLAPGSGVSDIQPIKMTYPGTQPMIPLVLTAVAAEPEMGIIVLIAGQERFSSSNWANLEVPTDMVQMNPATGQNNYWVLVSYMLDQEEGGRAFITERAQASALFVTDVQQVFTGAEDWQESQDYLTDLLTAHPYVTRFYSRLSAWEMTEDPMFEMTGGDDVSGVHDLSNRPPMEVCAGEIRPVVCGSTYCGLDAQCANTEAGVDGCVCNDNEVGRSIADPSSRGGTGRTVTCQRTNFDLLQSMEDEGTMQMDPCADTACGDGACVVVSGFPTCLCDEGFAAVVDQGELKCSKAINLYDSDQVTWPDQNSGDLCACDSTSDTRPGAAGLLGLALFVWWRRRRD